MSGGLDSTLACRLLLEQGIEVIAYNLRTPFCTCERKGGCGAAAVANELGIELVSEFAGEDYIALVKKPRFGRGAAMNPCIDCRIFILRRAKVVADARGAAFLFTGEVLGQRPMSQHRRALALIEREAGLEGKVLRPLSAQLFPPTEAEERGWVDRARLLALSGRRRQSQFALAKAWGLRDYACPAGGCLLTDKKFGERLADAFAHGEDTLADINLLKVGRHFRLASGAKVVVGRNEVENRRLAARLATTAGAVALEIIGVGSPVALLLKGTRADWPAAAALCLAYSDARQLPGAPARVWDATGDLGEILAGPPAAAPASQPAAGKMR